MIPKITKGSELDRIVGYLFGRGRHGEHTGQRLVAAYTDPATLAPPSTTRRGREVFDTRTLVTLLDAPRRAAARGPEKYVWHCSLSLTPGEAADDVKWRAIAEGFIEAMGYADCRWIAVHHGPSHGTGNDHIHLAVNRHTVDGKVASANNDFRRAQSACDALEDEHGLRKATPGRHGATKRPATTRREADAARRAKAPAPDRERLRRAVRAAAAGAESELEWVAAMRRAGLLVASAPRGWVPDDSPVTGYSVALAAEAGTEPRWYAGSRLDEDLGLPRMRHRWPGHPVPTRAEWVNAETTHPGPAIISRKVADIYSGRFADRLRDLAKQGPSASPGARREAADLFALLARRAEGTRHGRLSKAADSLARAAAPPRDAPPARINRTASVLRAIARNIAQLPGPRGRKDASATVELLKAAMMLIAAMYDLREAGRQLDRMRVEVRAAVGAAQTARQLLIGPAVTHHARRAQTAQGRHAAAAAAYPNPVVDLANARRPGGTTPSTPPAPPKPKAKPYLPPPPKPDKGRER